MLASRHWTGTVTVSCSDLDAQIRCGKKALMPEIDGSLRANEWTCTALGGSFELPCVFNGVSLVSFTKQVDVLQSWHISVLSISFDVEEFSPSPCPASWKYLRRLSARLVTYFSSLRLCSVPVQLVFFVSEDIFQLWVFTSSFTFRLRCSTRHFFVLKS